MLNNSARHTIGAYCVRVQKETEKGEAEGKKGGREGGRGLGVSPSSVYYRDSHTSEHVQLTRNVFL